MLAAGGTCVLRTSSHFIWSLPCTLMGLICVLVNQSAVWLHLSVLFAAGVQQKHRGWLGMGHARASVTEFLTPALCSYTWETLQSLCLAGVTRKLDSGSQTLEFLKNNSEVTTKCRQCRKSYHAYSTMGVKEKGLEISLEPGTKINIPPPFLLLILLFNLSSSFPSTSFSFISSHLDCVEAR